MFVPRRIFIWKWLQIMIIDPIDHPTFLTCCWYIQKSGKIKSQCCKKPGNYQDKIPPNLAVENLPLNSKFRLEHSSFWPMILRRTNIHGELSTFFKAGWETSKTNQTSPLNPKRTTNFRWMFDVSNIPKTKCGFIHKKRLFLVPGH